LGYIEQEIIERGWGALMQANAFFDVVKTLSKDNPLLSSAFESYERKDFAQALAAWQAILEQQPSLRQIALTWIYTCHDKMGNHRCSVLLTCV
jgi:hypothetical protein